MTFLPDQESGDFEGGTTGFWLPRFYPFGTSHGEVTNSTEHAHGGTHSAKMTLNEVYPNVLMQTENPSDPSVPGRLPAPGTPGSILIGGWLYSDHPDIDWGLIEAYFYETDGTLVGSAPTGSQAVVPGTWNHIQGTAQVIPGAADFVELRAYAMQDSSGGGPDLAIGTEVWWDDFYYMLGTNIPLRKRQLSSRRFTPRRGPQASR